MSRPNARSARNNAPATRQAQITWTAVTASQSPSLAANKSALNRPRKSFSVAARFAGSAVDGTVDFVSEALSTKPPLALISSLSAVPPTAAARPAAVSERSYHAAENVSRRTQRRPNDRAPHTTTSGATPISSTSESPTSAQPSTAATTTGTHRRRRPRSRISRASRTGTAVPAWSGSLSSTVAASTVGPIMTATVIPARTTAVRLSAGRDP